MSQDRRTFLKSAGVAVSAGVLAPAAASPGEQPKPGVTAMPTGMTFVTIKRGAEQSLGIKTERGILDVKRAEAALKLKAPTTIDDVFERGGGPQLKRLVERANSAKTDGYFLAEGSFEYGPCVTEPEKIVCIGLNYRKHAVETGNPVPKQPILFNKYNRAAGAPRRHQSVARGGRAVRLRGRAGHRHRQGAICGAARVSG